MIRTTNVKSGFVYLDDVGYVSEETFDRWTRRSKPQYGDVILTREAPVGEVGRFTSNDENIFLGQRLFHYRADPKLLDWNFFAYVLQSHEVQGRLRSMGFGATVEHIKVGDAENLLIPCPPVDVQRHIGSILAAYDDLIENNRRRMALLEDSARLLYREWFVRLRFPGYEHTPVVDGVPQGWERKTLGESIKLNYGKALKAETRIEGEFPVYGSSGIVGTHEKPLVKGPAIILGRKGNVGSVYWSSKSFFPIDTVYFVDADSSSLYLYYALKNMHFISTDVAVPGLNRDFAYSRFLLLPPATLLHAFLDTVVPVHAQLDKLTEMNQKLRAARDLLLPRLMGGEIAV
jgi:type I restriction enzyme S subunit